MAAEYVVYLWLRIVHLRCDLRSALLLTLFATLVATAAAIGSGGGIDCGNVNGHFPRHDDRFV